MPATGALADHEGNIRKLFLYSILMELPLWLPIWVLYLRDQLGFSLTQITLIDVPFFMLVVVAEVPTGAVADRFGRRVSLMLGAACYVFAVYVLGVANSYPVVLLSYVTWGLAVTLRSGADIALLYDSLKEAGRERDFQRVNGALFAARSCALLAGLLLGAPLAAATSYTFTFKASALIGLAALLVALTVREPRHAIARAHEPYLRRLRAGLHEAWRRPALRYIILYSGVLTAGTYGPLVVFQQPWLAEHGVGTAGLGLWQAPPRAAAIVAALGGAWLLRRTGERAAFFALPVGLVGFNLALAGIDHSWVAVAFLGMGLSQGLQDPTLSTYVNHRIESNRRATILSVQNVAGNLILAGMQPVAGLVADAYGLQAVFVMFAVAVMAFGGSAVLLWDRAERHDAALRELPVQESPEPAVAG
jgi:MFS family permease